jgi:rRNA processing protein Gar1
LNLFLYRAAAPSQSLVQVDNHTNVLISSDGTFNSSELSANSPGRYKIIANFTDYNGNQWESRIDLKVTPKCVDRFLIYPNKATYYAGETAKITIEAQKYSGGDYIGVGGVELNWSVRKIDGTIVASYTGLKTGDDGKYNATITVPTYIGTYILEVNNYAAKSTFEVIPFEVVLRMLDETGSTTRTTYAVGQTARLQVRVLYNGTTPTSGVYSFSGDIIEKSGAVLLHIPSTPIDNSTYTGTYDFEINSSWPIGSYMANITVASLSGQTVTSKVFFDVRKWKLWLTVPEDSGFLFGLTSFPSTPVKLVIKVTDLTTGDPITGLENYTSVVLQTLQGTTIQSIEVSYSNSSKGYIANFTMPSDIGQYILKVTVTKDSETLIMEKTLRVTNIVAYATPTDKDGTIKEIFGGVEPVYIVVKAKNETSPVAIEETNLEEVIDENGNPVPYTLINWSDTGSNTSLEWAYNLSYLTSEGKLVAILRLDNPKKGGVYTASISVNNKSALATVKFIIDPYRVCAFPKKEGEDWIRWQYSTSESIRFEIKVTEAKHKAGKAIFYMDDFICLGSNAKPAPVPGGGGGGGTETPVSGANVTVIKIINEQIQKEIPLSEVNITPGKTDSNGRAYVTLTPASGNWTGGWYHVIFQVTGPDGVTTGKGHSGFEARRFYIWGHGIDENGNWRWEFKPKENITIQVEMYDALNTMWWYSDKSEGGINGQAFVEKILYHGTEGEWFWPPIEYHYTGELPSTTIKNGKGNFTLLAPQGGWKSGEYSVVIRGVNEKGEEDYGWVWFSIRLWWAWAEPVDNETYKHKWEGFSIDENATLLVEIYNAGKWGGFGAEPLEEAPVTVSVKKLEEYSSWPPQEIENYYCSPIQLNETFDWNRWNSLDIPYLKNYTLELSPVNKWKSGYYHIVLNLTGVNGSQESGWGWFQVKAFYVYAQFVNASGNEIWTSKGGDNIYFNITTTKKSWSPWDISKNLTDAEPIDTNISEILLWMWSEDSWEPKTLRYPGDLNVSPIEIKNGQATIQLSKTDGSKWTSGWYSGEITLVDSQGNKDKGWLWFEIRPFEVQVEVLDENGLCCVWEVSSTSNITVNLTIVDPETRTPMPDNYSIEIYDETWEFKYESTRIESFSPKNFTEGSAEIIITPPGGAWKGRYHNLKITVTNDEGASGTGWAWFSVVPYKIEKLSVNGNPNQTYWVQIKPGENIIIEYRAYDPVTNQTLNVSVKRVHEWGKEYNFTTADGDDYVNGTENLTVIPPSGGWREGYHYIELQFEQRVRDYLSFDARSFTGWAWAPRISQKSNLTINLNVYEPDWVTPASVNITSIKIQLPEEKNFIDFTQNATFTNPCNGTCTIEVIPPSGGWPLGWYRARIEVTDSETGSTNATFDAWFEVSSPTVEIWYPYTGAMISGEVWFEAEVRNDPEGQVINVTFYLINASGDEILLGNGTRDSDYPVWHYYFNASEYPKGKYRVKAVAWGATGFISEAITGEFSIIEKPKAKFTGNFYEGVVDLDGDGYYDELQINATVNVTSEGGFYMYGSLWQGENWVAWGYGRLTTATTGLYNITMKYSGMEIRRSKLSGNYTLRYTYLYESNEWTIVDQCDNCYNTSYYNYSEFQKPPAELTGNITISYEDTDANGVFDILIVGIGVNVFKEGDYRVYLGMEKDNYWVSKDAYVEGLSVGTHIVNVTFTPSEVSEGNWTIKDIELSKGWWEWLEWQNPQYTFEVKYTNLDIKIVYYSDDLDDGVNALDDDFSQVVLTTWANDGDVKPLNVSLIFDANADGDLMDVSAGDDYNLYNVIYIIDKSAGDIQFGYNVTEDASWSDGDGVIEKGDRVKIRGLNYVITNPPDVDQTVEFGPAISKSLTSLTIDPDKASVVSGTKKVLLNNGSLYFYDGSFLVDGPFDISNVVVPYDLTNNLTSDEFKAYRVYVVANGTDSAKLNFVEKSQLTTISNDESGAMGYYSVKIDDPDFAGDDELIFLGDPISMVKGEKTDLPDTYYQLDFKIDKKFDIKRRKETAVASGTKLKPTVTPWNNFLIEDIIVSVYNSTAIKIDWKSDDLNDDGDEWNENFTAVYDSRGLINVSINADTIQLGTAPYTSNTWIDIAGDGLKFDANWNGNLTDSEDYTVYNGLYIIDDASGYVQLGFTPILNSTYNNGTATLDEGEVLEIKGANYVIIDAFIDDQDIELGPAIMASLNNESTFSLDKVVNITNTLAAIVINNTLYLYEEGNPVDNISISDTNGNINDLTNDITSDTYKAYRMYIWWDTNASLFRLTMAEKSQTVKFFDEMKGGLGYYKTKVGDVEFPLVGYRIIFLSEPITLVKGDTVDVSDTYFAIKYSIDKYMDIIRKKTAIVNSGTELEPTATPWNDFLVNPIILSIVGGG